MKIKFSGNIVCVFGPPGSGKTNWMKWLFRRNAYSRHIIYDPMHEYDPNRYNVARPPRSTAYRRYETGNDELNKTVDELIMASPPAIRPRYFVIDEANRLLPNNKPPGEAAQDLIDFNRHYEPGITLFALCRRPAQINTDLENLASYYVCFGYQGKNDRRAYGDIHVDLVDALDEKDRYGPVVVGQDNEISTFEPVDYLGETPTI